VKSRRAETGNRRGLPAAALRGGNWDNGTNAGAFALNLNNAPSNWNNNVGARCCARDVLRV